MAVTAESSVPTGGERYADTAAAAAVAATTTTVDSHTTLKYSLLGPSLTKSGQDNVDQQKVSEIIYEASKGSKFFANEAARDRNLTAKIERILRRKTMLEQRDLTAERRRADELIAQLELGRDLSQVIVHIDCDAFYAAVELLDRPELEHVPFSVGRGVLTTCNYHARRFGCRSGMAGFVARRLCPQLVQLPLNFAKYTAKAQEVRQILVDYDARFESASIDEAYLNITAYCREHDLSPSEAVAQLRRRVHAETRITVSAGIAANAKLAKICSNRNKPDGQFLLPRDRASIMAFMRDLPMRKVNGIGRVWERELDAVGVRTCGDLYTHRAYLMPLFGEKAFVFLMQCYLGVGRTRVQPAEEYTRKSVGTESTFGDMSDTEQLRAQLRWTAEELEKDLRRTGFKGRTLCLKVKLHTYEVLTRQVVPPQAVYLADDLYRHAAPMLAKLQDELPEMRLRLMGLRCTHLVSMQKPDTMTFFGFKRRQSKRAGASESGLDDVVGEQQLETSGSGVEEEQFLGEEWEDDTWLEGGEPAAWDVDDDDGAHETTVTPPPAPPKDTYRHHGKEILPNPKPLKSTHSPDAGDGEDDDDWWECPICARPQATDEKAFNAHIDLCLSRSAIRDVVQQHSDLPLSEKSGHEEAATASAVASKMAKVVSGSGTKRRAGTAAASHAADKRQRKLFFG